MIDALKRLLPILFVMLGCAHGTLDTPADQWTVDFLVGYHLELEHDSKVEEYKFLPNGLLIAYKGEKSVILWPPARKKVFASVVYKYKINENKELVIYEGDRIIQRLRLKGFRNNKVFAEKNGRDVIYLRTKR